MRPAGRRRPAEHPPPTPANSADPWQFLSTPVPGRDSDASFTSSRPSTASIVRSSNAVPNISDRSYQASALRTINAYLSSQSLPFSLKPPLPSAKDITETLKYLLHRLGFRAQKLDEELNQVLKFLKCPLKLNKSALRAPGTPHSWPNLLAVIHWLVQIIKYNGYVESSPTSLEENRMFKYTANSYVSYIRGDDEAVDALDEEFMVELKEGRDKMEENVKVLEENVKELEEKLESLKAGPSQKEVLEQEKAALEKDVMKFHMIIEQLDGHLVEVQKKLEEKDRELEVKVEERKRISEENEELKRKIEEQGINFRDAERMKRELQALDRDIEETEAARNGWEEKIWELDSEIGRKFEELEGLVLECNQAIRRLKLGNGFQYQLNAKGSTPFEVLGLDYKMILKPALTSFSEDIKSGSMEKWEELISLQQLSRDNVAKIEEMRKQIIALELHINEVEAQMNLMRKETHEYVSRSAREARKMAEEVEIEAQKMFMVEKEAAEYLQTNKIKLQETIAQSEEEVKMCARELFDLINSVAAYKEYTGSKISRMRNDLLETAGAVADIYKEYRPSKVRVVTDSGNSS
ncbi:kinetochore protein NDC80 homolog [Primulina tabacum]|uniref:kinetochore protein NDC80 homolog n=1 Tax=Primulina tabacum TaxID=48773 RepID=UPI003F59B341